MINVVQFV